MVNKVGLDFSIPNSFSDPSDLLKQWAFNCMVLVHHFAYFIALHIPGLAVASYTLPIVCLSSTFAAL